MATMNQKRASARPTTHEGAPGYHGGAEAELRRTVMACLLWEDSFYENGMGVAERIKNGVAHVSPETAARIAIEAREQMHIRHAPLWIVRHMARGGGSIVGDTIARVIQRPDEMTELVSMCLNTGMTSTLTSQVKRGLAEAFGKFDEYQLAKYNRKDREVTLRDVLFMAHPKPETDEQRDLWSRLIDGTLETPDTWEVALSSGGDAKEHWARLLSENRLGGLALLRNLRNMQEAGVSKGLVRAAIAQNPFRRVLPFRFVSAAKHAPDFEPDLEAAMLRSLGDMEKLGGKTALLIDVSGSMDMPLSRRSEMTRQGVAAAMGIMLRELSDDIDVIAFGSRAAVLRPRRGFALLSEVANAQRNHRLDHGTNMDDAHRLAKSRGYDRVIIVSDMQSHQRLSQPEGKGYVVNVASYQNGIGYGAWTEIDGWSDAIVRYIQEAA